MHSIKLSDGKTHSPKSRVLRRHEREDTFSPIKKESVLREDRFSFLPIGRILWERLLLPVPGRIAEHFKKII